jgi:hypothetical protein
MIQKKIQIGLHKSDGTNTVKQINNAGARGNLQISVGASGTQVNHRESHNNVAYQYVICKAGEKDEIYEQGTNVHKKVCYKNENRLEITKLFSFII